MLSVFAEFVPCEEPTVLVPEATLELWEQLLHTAQGADLELLVEGEALRAHQAVLRSASPVVHALLSAPMKEQLSKSIEVDGTLEGTKLFLRLMRLFGRLSGALRRLFGSSCVDSRPFRRRFHDLGAGSMARGTRDSCLSRP